MLEYFTKIDEIDPAELRAGLEQAATRPDWVLLDVRQPHEYRDGHLPGAVSIPLAQLDERLGELDSTAETFVYCSTGERSRAAAGILLHRGFRRVRSVAGGYRSWQGMTAQGMPQADLSIFNAVSKPEQHVALAWSLEDGARRFYQHVSDRMGDTPRGRLFAELAQDEIGHQQTLEAVYEGLTKTKPGADFPTGCLPDGYVPGAMEGGYRVAEVLAKLPDLTDQAVIELAQAVEANAYDHYLFLERQEADGNSQRVFEVLAGEERRHLQRLTRALDALFMQDGPGTPVK